MNELVIDKNSNGIDVALLYNKQLTELHKEDHVSSFQIGDVYLAKVKKIMPNLNAAFLDVGHERDAFLHYTDLGVHFKSVQKLSKIVTQGGLTNASLAEFETEEPIVCLLGDCYACCLCANGKCKLLFDCRLRITWPCAGYTGTRTIMAFQYAESRSYVGGDGWISGPICHYL